VPRRQPHPRPARKRNHRKRSGAVSAPITFANVDASGAPSIVMRTSTPNAIVIEDRAGGGAEDNGDGGVHAGALAGPASLASRATRTGTNAGVLRAPIRSRRQRYRRLALTSALRAISVTTAPGSSMAATSRAFSAALHRLRRSTDVMTSTHSMIAFPSGARVWLATGHTDIQLDRPRSHVLLRGKGRKERIVPIPSDLAKGLKALMNERGVAFHETRPIFVGSRETRLTRFGATHIVRRAVATATLAIPDLARKPISPYDPAAIWGGPTNHPGLVGAFASRHDASLCCCRRRNDATRTGKGGCFRQRRRSL